jgi:hypothetical protein
MQFLESSNRRKATSIERRAWALNVKIAALESPPGSSGTRTLPGLDATPRALEPDPGSGLRRECGATSAAGPSDTGASSGEPGVGKFDLLKAWRRLQQPFARSVASNPKLISYLAAGTIQGLSSFHYERRVMRNRVLALLLLLSLAIWGIIATSIRH